MRKQIKITLSVCSIEMLGLPYMILGILNGFFYSDKAVEINRKWIGEREGVGNDRRPDRGSNLGPSGHMAHLRYGHSNKMCYSASALHPPSQNLISYLISWIKPKCTQQELLIMILLVQHNIGIKVLSGSVAAIQISADIYGKSATSLTLTQQLC